MKQSILTTFLLIVFVYSGLAQTFLVVDTYRGKQRTEYHIGDEIAFKLKDSQEDYYGIIQNMKKDMLFVSEVAVLLKDISVVYINKKPSKLRKIENGASKAAQAAWIIPTIAMLNPVIIDGSDPINAKNVAISALALASPFYINSRKNKKAKIGKRHRIRLVSFDDLNVSE